MQTNEKNISKRNFIGMLGVNACLGLLGLFVNVFLIAQVFFVTGYCLMSVSLFLLLEVIAIFVFYALSSFVCKKVRAIWMTRISTVLVCIFLFLVVVWDDGLYSHFMLFGFIWGSIVGLYWGAMNFLIAKVFNREGVARFFVGNFAVAAVVGIVFPFTFGFAIDYGSWILTSGAVLAVGVLMFVFTLIIKTEMQDDRHLRMREYFRSLKRAEHLRPAIYLWFVVFLAGFPHMTIALMTILIIIVYGTNTGIGIMGSVFAVVGIVVLLLYKVARPRVKNTMFWIASIFPLVVSIPLFFFVEPWSIIIFNLALVLIRNVVMVEEAGARINAVRFWGGEEFLIESHLFYEFAFFVGRMFACGLLILIAFIGVTQVSLAIAISVIIGCWTLHGLLLWFWKRKYAATEVSLKVLSEGV